MSINILLADDSITIQKVIGIIFGGEEYALTVVDNGKSALEKALKTSPDVLLIDALMPGMSGYEVCEAIRATPELAAKPILLLTGTFEPFDEVRAKSCGADDFLAKPFESQQIVTKVRELFELGASRAVAVPQSETIADPFTFEPPVAPSTAEHIQKATEEDIWGAFTPAVEPADTAMFQDTSPEQALEPDVLAIISEEPVMQPEIYRSPEAAQTDVTGSEWTPAEENTFEFEGEAVAEIPAPSITGFEPLDQEVSFGEITFEEEAQPEPAESIDVLPPLQELAPPEASFSETSASFIESAVPDFNETVAPAIAVIPDIAEPGTVAKDNESSPVVLTEAQLKAAIMAVSQETIERIIWEVVPDLAETLIKDAIRKIKEGQ